MALHHMDKDVTLAVNSLHSPVTDAVWQFFSATGIWFILYAAVIVFLFIRLGWKRAGIVVLSGILCVVLCDQFSNLVKDAVQRLRPVHDADMLARGLHVLENPGNLYGFFSAHAANTAGFAACTYKGFLNDKGHSYRAYGLGIGLWSFFVGISRVFVGKHYLGDVLTGFAVGTGIGLLCGFLAQYAILKLKLD